jgi:hypothetical protein
MRHTRYRRVSLAGGLGLDRAKLRLKRKTRW